MNCTNCGYPLEKKWKCCPKCAAKVPRFKYVIVIAPVLVIFVIFGIILFSYISDLPHSEETLLNHLEEKYDEDFVEISPAMSVVNPDVKLSCDGADFGTIEREGTTEFYKVYSKENNLEFFLYYDTEDKNDIHDTYKTFQNRRNITLNVYEEITFDAYKVEFINDIKSITTTILSKEQLSDLVSFYEDHEADEHSYISDELVYYIADDALPFCQNNLTKIMELNNFLNNLLDDNDYDLDLTFIFNGGVSLRLKYRDSIPSIYDSQYAGRAWNEPITDFVLRDSY